MKYRCMYCGGFSDERSCKNCGAVNIGIPSDDVVISGDSGWVEVTCLGDKNLRFLNLMTGKIQEMPPETYATP